MAIIVLEQIQKDIENLPEDAQYLLMDFLEILKKRYSKTEPKSNPSAPEPETAEDDWSDLIGSIEAEPDLSRNYKNYLNLVELGVPKTDIVLAFDPPNLRKDTDFAAS